jgi:hypothetical protein
MKYWSYDKSVEYGNPTWPSYCRFRVDQEALLWEEPKHDPFISLIENPRARYPIDFSGCVLV